MFDSLNTGVIITDHNLLIEYLNASAENLLGISKNRAPGESLLLLLGDDEEFCDILNRSMDSGLGFAIEARLPANEADAEERIVDCRVSSLPREDAGRSLLIEMTDVTRRSKISRENALLIQHGAGRQMIRQLAHEIKNPLGGLRGAAQLLERQLENAELREYTSVIISEADRLAALVDTLLGPGGPPNKQPLNIHELLEYVVRLVETGKGQSLKIVRDYDAGLQNHRSALAIYQQSGARSLLLDALHDMGRIHLELGDPVSAEAFFQQAMEIAQEIDLEQAVTVNLLALGDLQFQRELLDDAYALYFQAADRSARANEASLKAESDLRMSTVSRKRPRAIPSSARPPAWTIRRPWSSSGKMSTDWPPKSRLR